VPRLLEQSYDGSEQQSTHDALYGAAPVARVNLLVRVA
jgi:hypothetical protein